ncbi:MAG: hypothetical protein ACLGI3_09715 [Actinomycetes bacterium]
MTVVRLPTRGQWAWDVRGEGRAVRISTHVESGLVNLSVWRHDACVGTVRLLPSEVANLMAGLSEGLAEIARSPHATADAPSEESRRLRRLEERLAGLESRLGASARRPLAPVEWVRERLAGRRSS